MVADAQPTFWRPHLDAVGTLCFNWWPQDLEPETPTLAIELVLCLCSQAGGMVRKHPFTEKQRIFSC